MLQLGVVLLLAAGGLFYLSAVDRMSSLALHVVELDGALPIPSYALAGALGTLALASHLARALTRAPPARARPTTARRAANVPISDGGSFRELVNAHLMRFSGHPGCRIVPPTQPGGPLALIIRDAPSKRASRAITDLGEILSAMPTPSRLQIQFISCPPGTESRRVQVNGALRDVLATGSFHSTQNLDTVEIMFHEPDPRWIDEW